MARKIDYEKHYQKYLAKRAELKSRGYVLDEVSKFKDFKMYFQGAKDFGKSNPDNYLAREDISINTDIAKKIQERVKSDLTFAKQFGGKRLSLKKIQSTMLEGIYTNSEGAVAKTQRQALFFLQWDLQGKDQAEGWFGYK